VDNKNTARRVVDEDLVGRFVAYCADRDMTLQQMGDSVNKTKAWASLIVNNKIGSLKWQTANRIRRLLNKED